jgi:hypothetical protein
MRKAARAFYHKIPMPFTLSFNGKMCILATRVDTFRFIALFTKN